MFTYTYSQVKLSYIARTWVLSRIFILGGSFSCHSDGVEFMLVAMLCYKWVTALAICGHVTNIIMLSRTVLITIWSN